MAKRAKPNLTKLAKEYAKEYSTADWSDIEDDVTLCVWAQKATGEELTLKEAGEFRKLLDAEVEKLHDEVADAPKVVKVVIFVEGGLVTGCTSNDPRLKVVVIDRDNLSEEEDPDAAEAEAAEGTDDCTHDVY